MTKNYTVVRQDWLESERGWGCRPDGYSLHMTDEHRVRYIEEYWRSMPDSVPDEYSRPCGDPERFAVDKNTYDQVVASDKGIRCYR